MPTDLTDSSAVYPGTVTLTEHNKWLPTMTLLEFKAKLSVSVADSPISDILFTDDLG